MLLDAVAAGGKKPVRALGEKALVLATGGEASTVVVRKALCGKGLLYCPFGMNKIIFLLFSFLCLIWHVIERYE